MANILVLDDQTAFAEGTQSLLREMGHSADICAWIEDLPEVEASHRRRPYDLALVDLVFADRQLSVLDALDALTSWEPRPAIVIFTAGGESRRHFIEDALGRPGVAGGVPKNAPSEQLRRCIDIVLSGGEHYDHEIAAYRPASHRPPPEDLLGPHARIWFALARGVTSHEAIAAEIGCRPKTVQNAIRPMGNKLVERGLTSNPHPTLRDLIHYAARHHEYFGAMERRWRSNVVR